MILLLIVFFPFNSFAESSCDGLSEKSRYRKELEQNRVTHKKYASSLQSAATAVDLQNQMMKQSLKDFDEACKEEKEILKGFNERIGKATSTGKNCEIDHNLAFAYYAQFEITDKSYKKLRDASIRRDGMDMDGNEAVRAILRDLKNNPEDLAKIFHEREMIWESTSGGLNTRGNVGKKQRPVFAEINSVLRVAENKLFDFREELRNKAVFFAERFQSCGKLVVSKPNH